MSVTPPGKVLGLHTSLCDFLTMLCDLKAGTEPVLCGREPGRYWLYQFGMVCVILA